MTWHMVNMGKVFPGGSEVKNLPAHAGAGGLSFGWEDPLEEEMATHSSILAWKIPQRGACWTPVGGVAESSTTEETGHLCTNTGEGKH